MPRKTPRLNSENSAEQNNDISNFTFDLLPTSQNLMPPSKSSSSSETRLLYFSQLLSLLLRQLWLT